MLNSAEIDNRANTLFAEIDSAFSDAVGRLGNSRQVKLGDLNLRDDFYADAKVVIISIYRSPRLRKLFSTQDTRARQFRRILLVFMSELIYWEYENSFWNKLYEVLGIPSDWGWFTDQMSLGYFENNIELITWTGRHEYVRTIILESGFSRQLVQDAKHFVYWYFENHSDLDPRNLDKSTFQEIIKSYGKVKLDNEEIFDLLREMVGSVSLLIREIRNKFLMSSDFEDSSIINQLEKALGFHPIRGIFGFRKIEDIEELLESISKRVKPNGFIAIIKRKLIQNRSNIIVITPDGKSFEGNQAKEVPILFGNYTIFEKEQSEIQVVPRETLTTSKLEDMLKKPENQFFRDGEAHVWIHASDPFEVFQGSNDPEEARRYVISGLQGYLWYGLYKIAIPLTAEKDGKILARFSPRQDIAINPRLRLNGSGEGIQVSIPSFICFEPQYAGKTVLFKLNDRVIDDTTYVINREGLLQFQTTRVAEVLPDDERLNISLITSDGNVILYRVIYHDMPEILLFNRANRELIRPGIQEYSSNRFVIFSEIDIDISKINNIKVEKCSRFGKYFVNQFRWVSTSKPLEISLGKDKWKFAKSADIFLECYSKFKGEIIRPDEPYAVFDPNDLDIIINYFQVYDEATTLFEKLSIVIEKDGQFISDYKLIELYDLGFIKENSQDKNILLNLSIILENLLERFLIDKRIGTYHWILTLRPNPIADMETLSDVEFMILPNFELILSNELLLEGQATIFSVKCEQSLISTQDGTSTDIIQLDFQPEVIYNPELKKLVSCKVEKSIRLVFPPTKVNIEFSPSNLFAARLLSREKLFTKSSITYSEASDAEVIILGPPEEIIQITTKTYETRIALDSVGRGSFGLTNILTKINEEKTTLEITYKKFRFAYEIVWHAKLKFSRENNTKSIDIDSDTTFSLYFEIDGPTNSEISFKLTDYKLRNHGVYKFLLSELRSQFVNLPIDFEKVRDGKAISCSAYCGNIKLDSIVVPIGVIAGDEVSTQLENELEALYLEIEELPPFALLDKLNLLEGLDQKGLKEKFLKRMYSTQLVDMVRADYKQKKRTQQEIEIYFEHFDAKWMGNIQQIPKEKLKLYCGLPITSVKETCARELIIRNDCVGVDHVIEDLLIPKKISWEKGLDILSANRSCSVENICDRIDGDKLEFESYEVIDLMIALAENFNPQAKRMAKEIIDWKKALEYIEDQTVLEVTVLSHNNRGVKAPFGLITGMVLLEDLDQDLHGLRGKYKDAIKYLPRLIKTKINVVVIKADRKNENLLFSERIAREKITRSKLSELTKGDIVIGTVKHTTDFGAFIDLGGITGLLHISEIFWDKQASVDDLPGIGREINVYISDVDLDKMRVSLSLKRLQPNPLVDKYKIGSKVKACVTGIKENGVFVHVDNQINGFIPLSELSSETIGNPNQVVKLGEIVEARILNFSQEKQHLTLSIKQAFTDELYLGHFRVRQQ